jgi:Ca2+-binding EF-hand superfamily protein
MIVAFDLLDTDGDGSISRNEWENFMARGGTKVGL